MDDSKANEKNVWPLRVGFQGIKGAYSEMAATNYFQGRPVKLHPIDNFEGLFEALNHEVIDFAVVPIENSLAGSIHENYDHMVRSSIWIHGEYKQRIEHSLIVNKDSAIEDIEKVYSHPQALYQCRRFLKKLNVDLVPYFDTAGAVKHLADAGLKSIAAIAGKHAALDYGLSVAADNIQDENDNYTRFFIVGKRSFNEQRYPGKTWKEPSKTSIVFALGNVPGGLHKALSVFAIRDIDLTKIESRPLQQKGSLWKYRFHMDFEGHINDVKISRAIDHLADVTSFVKVLGSYRMHENSL